VLGGRGAAFFLVGEWGLGAKAAERAIREKIAAPLGMDLTAAADGILRVAATAMSYAVKGVTTERGLDVGDFALVAYGGAGPLHAVAVAREIGMRKVIVPSAPGVFSAFGMLFSDLRYDFVRTWFTPLDDAPFDEIERVYRALEQQGREAIAGASVAPQRVAIKRHFDAMHAQRYGTSAPAERAEIVSLRSTITGLMRKPPQHKIARGQKAPPAAASGGKRQVLFDG